MIIQNTWNWYNNGMALVSASLVLGSDEDISFNRYI